MSVRRATHKDEKDMYNTYMAGFADGGIHPSLLFTHPFRNKYPEDWEQANESIITERLDMNPSYAHNMVVEADGKAVAWALWRRNFDDVCRTCHFCTTTPNLNIFLITASGHWLTT